MKYFLQIYGCQMNKSDSERIKGILEEINYKPVHKIEQADLIIIITCSVRQTAVDRIYGQLRNLEEIKNKKPHLKIILTGCLLFQDKEKINKKFNYLIDEIIDIKNIGKLPQILKRKIKLDKKLINNYFHIKPKYNSKIEAFVPIMTGCNNYCAYCVVPYVRGPEISRPTEEIIEEIKELIKKGYKKITLLGQNVNSYHSKLKIKNSKFKKINFVDLIKIINSLPGNFWFSFITNHPKDMSNKLINTLPKLEKLCHYIHLPIQSGNNQILKKMNRNYTANHYLSLIKKIRKVWPDVNISTDIIVGFPGETKKQFLDTKKIMEKVKFDMVYIACYSPRSQTAAYKMKDTVSPEEKKHREEILTAVLKKTALENNQKYLGKETEILITQKNPKKSNIYYGETKTLKQVLIESQKNILGKWLKVKIIKISPWGLKGKLL